ncbi:MAG: hypothetical protein HYX61_13655 [Gammaproteobacteria bacterium]|jgi:phage-related protein|nr:hypothetical protein [Gammaproteobacteria bacterium]
MARENNDSVWEYINSFRHEIKQQIINILNVIKNSKHHIKNLIQQTSAWMVLQLGGFKANAIRFIQSSAQTIRAGITYGWQRVSYILRNFPQVLNQSLHWCARVLQRGFDFGYRTTMALLNVLKDLLLNLPTHVVTFAKQCVRQLKQGFEIGKWLIKNTFRILKSIAIELKDVAIEVVKTIGRLCRYVFNNFGTLARQFLNGIYQFLKELPEIAINVGRFLKNFTVDLFKGLYRLGKEILMNIGPFLKELSLETLRAVRWVATTAAKKVWNVVGITLGSIAAVFDLRVDVFKSVFGNAPAQQVARYSHGSHQADDRQVVELNPRSMTPFFRGQVEASRETFTQAEHINIQDSRHENRLRRA